MERARDVFKRLDAPLSLLEAAGESTPSEFWATCRLGHHMAWWLGKRAEASPVGSSLHRETVLVACFLARTLRPTGLEETLIETLEEWAWGRGTLSEVPRLTYDVSRDRTPPALLAARTVVNPWSCGCHLDGIVFLMTHDLIHRVQWETISTARDGLLSDVADVIRLLVPEEPLS